MSIAFSADHYEQISYTEGIDILYRTNTFHISSLPLLLNLARLMPPHRLATVTRVELLWDVFDDRRKTLKAIYKQAQEAQASPPSAPPQSQLSTKFHELCQMTPRIFPNARNVYVALQSPIEPFPWASGPDCIPLVERAILGPVEDMFRAMGPAPEKEFSLAIQLGGFLAVAVRRWREENLDPSVYRGPPCHFDVDDERGTFVLDGVPFRSVRAWRPLGPGEAGYWLRPGLTDSWTRGLETFDIWGTWDDPI